MYQIYSNRPTILRLVLPTSLQYLVVSLCSGQDWWAEPGRMLFSACRASARLGERAVTGQKQNVYPAKGPCHTWALDFIGTIDFQYLGMGSSLTVHSRPTEREMGCAKLGSHALHPQAGRLPPYLRARGILTTFPSAELNVHLKYFEFKCDDSGRFLRRALRIRP
jgi:hypothetical protein